MNQNELKVGKVIYMGDWSPENLAVVRAVLDPLAWMVPAWATHCGVFWASDKPDTAIDSSIEYDYRRTRLRFFPAFVESNPDDRRYMVIHDLLHGFTSVVVDYASDTIGTLLPANEASKFREHALRELRIRNESATQDLAFCLNEHLPKPPLFDKE